ncbi:MAG: leucine-rich repeat domain-containing protein [Bacteroidaceae bacterium]|nr:leucine-rich repeat domain-containing protein [Bacteroidaceae bacterium]
MFMMKRKLKSMLLVLAVTLCSPPTLAHDFEVDGVYYNITSADDLTAEVTFKGNHCDDYSNEYSGSVTIPQTVTHGDKIYRVERIGDYAFHFCTGLTAIAIPSSVTSIGENAFEICASLTSVNLPNSITMIEHGAFSGCSGLTEVTLSHKLTSIGSCAFYDCKWLTKIDIPNSVMSIGERAFHQCKVLTEIAIPGSVTSVGVDAFLGTAWYNAQHNGIIYVGKALYKYKGTMPADTSIEVQEGTSSISPQAFYGCSGLAYINIPSSVTSIGYEAFYECSSLASFTIQNSETSIDWGVFFGTPWYDNQPNGVVYVGKALYNYKGEMPYGTSVEVREGTVSISPSAFFNCDRMASITFPTSLKSIGDCAFWNCNLMTSITIPSSVTSIGISAFSSCYTLTEVISYIPADKLFPIPSNTFELINLAECVLKVPFGAKATYESTKYWSLFTNIVEMAEEHGTTGIVLKQITEEPNIVFNLQGRRITQPAKGVNIVNGKKVMF